MLLVIMCSNDLQQIAVKDTNGEIKLLKSIDPHKATGPDNIPAHFLNNSSEELSPFQSFSKI
jgi:hypothetical protein